MNCESLNILVGILLLEICCIVIMVCGYMVILLIDFIGTYIAPKNIRIRNRHRKRLGLSKLKEWD